MLSTGSGAQYDIYRSPQFEVSPSDSFSDKMREIKVVPRVSRHYHRSLLNIYTFFLYRIHTMKIQEEVDEWRTSRGHAVDMNTTSPALMRRLMEYT